jgi:hypothetical protein
MWLSTVACTVTLALAIFRVTLAADAQPSAKVPRIGFLITDGQRTSCSNPASYKDCKSSGTWRGGTSANGDARRRGPMVPPVRARTSPARR